MNIQVRDFGPITEGRVTVKPLTVFIGPNNSGKSYMAMLTYVLAGAQSWFRRVRLELEPGRENTLETDLKERVCSELERCFGAEIASLTRAKTSGFQVAFSGGEDGLGFRISADGASVHLEDVSFPREYIRSEHHEDTKREPRVLRLAWLRAALVPSQHYLPAARSGILQGHRALAAAVISQMPLFGFREVRIPRLSGVVADFIGELLRLYPAQRGVSHVAEFLQRELCDGSIELEPRGPSEYPEILYRHHKLRVPMHRASSMISESAPIVLYLKHVVGKGDQLIIEEPEAHLHPHSQRIMARGLARMVRAGLNVLITTHSDYLVHQISNLIRVSALAPEQRARLGYHEEELLDPDQVAAYLFHCPVEGEGSLISELPVTGADGIPEEEFIRIAEALYDETVSLEQRRGTSR